MSEYRVRLGGSPPESADVYDTRVGAEAAAIAMAEEMRAKDVASGQTVGVVDLYGGPDELEWGACPEGNTGAYYPVIVEITE